MPQKGAKKHKIAIVLTLKPAVESTPSIAPIDFSFNVSKTPPTSM